MDLVEEPRNAGGPDGASLRECSRARTTPGETSPEVVKVKYPFLPHISSMLFAKKQMRHGGGVVTFEVKEASSVDASS